MPGPMGRPGDLSAGRFEVNLLPTFGGLSITFQSPWWLLLLLLLPLVMFWSTASLAGLGRTRQILAILLRSTVLTLLIAALAEMQWVSRGEGFCTFFLLDYSQSIPETGEVGKAGEPLPSKMEAALNLINDAIANRQHPEDQVGLIVFGRQPKIELPPAPYPMNGQFSVRGIGASIDRQHTHIEAAIKMALGSFPPDVARRLVLISDGNENLGNALRAAVAAQKNGNGTLPIDVVPIEYRYDKEVLVDRVVVPSDLKVGDVANLKIVMRSAQAASGSLKVFRNGRDGQKIIAQQKVQLNEGLTVLTIREKIEAADSLSFDAEFTPDPEAGDQLARNNRRTGLLNVRGKGRVLLIEQSLGAFGDLFNALSAEKIEVDRLLPIQLKESLTQFQPYDAIILANVPAEQVPESMQEVMAAACRDHGTGFIMVGGPESFGAGGYKNSPLEKILPVEMEIKSTKVRGKGALVMIMHGCEIPEGNFWEKETARLAVEKMGPEDECGILGLDPVVGKMRWEAALQRVGNGSALKRLISRMTPSDMPDFEDGMQKALTALRATNATNKHVIILSDGDPQPPSDRTLSSFVQNKITCSTVAIAAHGVTERVKMKRISTATKGRFYEVLNPRMLPQIYIQETRLISRPLIYERNPPWAPILATVTEPVAGLPTALPAIRGLVLTTPKNTAAVPIVSPHPGELGVVPIVAHWSYFIGRSVAVTIDAGQNWTAGWQKDPLYKTFWSQIVRWALRPSESNDLSLSLQEREGEVALVVNAIDKGSEFLNFLKLKGMVSRPGQEAGKVESQAVEFQQTEPGKYEARFKADSAGAYFVTVTGEGAGGRPTVLTTGIDISYPPEFRDLESNRSMLENLASVTAGRVIDLRSAAGIDFFPRSAPPVRKLRDAWPALVLAALSLFLFDVGVRRVAIDPREIILFCRKCWLRFRQKPALETSTTLERLKGIKSAVETQLRERQTESLPQSRINLELGDSPIQNLPPILPEITRQAAAPAKSPTPPKLASETKPAAETSFERLMKAKQEALAKRKETEGG